MSKIDYEKNFFQSAGKMHQELGREAQSPGSDPAEVLQFQSILLQASILKIKQKNPLQKVLDEK